MVAAPDPDVAGSSPEGEGNAVGHGAATLPKGELVDAVTTPNREYINGDDVRESEKQRGWKIVRQGLKQLGWTETQLRKTRKGHPAKLKLARRLRAQTTMTWDWISQQLHAGAWRSLVTRLRETQK